jgi:hypothetical protein
VPTSQGIIYAAYHLVTHALMVSWFTVLRQAR